MLAGAGGEHALHRLSAVAPLETWRSFRLGLDEVFLHPVVMTYALDVIDAVRSRAGSRQPLSTRAALSMVRVARARARLVGRDHVTPDDIQAVVVPALAHRIVDATNDDLPTARDWVREFTTPVPVPPLPGT